MHLFVDVHAGETDQKATDQIQLNMKIEPLGKNFFWGWGGGGPWG